MDATRNSISAVPSDKLLTVREIANLTGSTAQTIRRGRRLVRPATGT